LARGDLLSALQLSRIIRQDKDETPPDRQRYACKAGDRKFDDLTNTIGENEIFVKETTPSRTHNRLCKIVSMLFFRFVSPPLWGDAHSSSIESLWMVTAN